MLSQLRVFCLLPFFLFCLAVCFCHSISLFANIAFYIVMNAEFLKKTTEAATIYAVSQCRSLCFLYVRLECY